MAEGEEPLGRLETVRLVLEPLGPGDAALIHDLWTERDPRVPPHRRLDADGHPSVAEVADRIETDRASGRADLLLVRRRLEGDAVGYCGLVAGGDDVGEAELAFELLRRVHGHRYAIEAARAVVSRTVDLGHRRLRASVRVWNVASRHVLTKIGFEEFGETESDEVHGDSLTMLLTLFEDGSPYRR